MKKNVVIKVENLSKKYVIGQEAKYLTLREQLLKLPQKFILNKRPKTREFWALRNVSFEVNKGEVIGVIGKNGAGKSTLLKILSKIVEPTSGQITTKGKVASLLEVGTGFNSELTGRENIYLSGAILGMSKKEIDKKYESIVKFSGIDKFIDTPVKKYSSGMYVRLAFAVASHLDSDILLVDEVLAVGDVDFQKKCLGKMSDLSKSGRTVIFVSHNLKAITELCPTAILLNEGSSIFQGKVHDAIQRYLNPKSNLRLKQNKKTRKDVQLLSCYLVNDKNKMTSVVSHDTNVTIIVNYKINRVIKGLQIVAHIWNMNRVHVLSTSDIDTNAKILLKRRKTGIYQAKIKIPKYILSPNTYQIKAACGIPNTNGIDIIDGPIFTISGSNLYYKNVSQGRKSAIISLPLRWKSSYIKKI